MAPCQPVLAGWSLHMSACQPVRCPSSRVPWADRAAAGGGPALVSGAHGQAPLQRGAGLPGPEHHQALRQGGPSAALACRRTSDMPCSSLAQLRCSVQPPAATLQGHCTTLSLSAPGTWVLGTLQHFAWADRSPCPLAGAQAGGEAPGRSGRAWHGHARAGHAPAHGAAACLPADLDRAGHRRGALHSLARWSQLTLDCAPATAAGCCSCTRCPAAGARCVEARRQRRQPTPAGRHAWDLAGSHHEVWARLRR